MQNGKNKPKSLGEESSEVSVQMGLKTTTYVSRETLNRRDKVKEIIMNNMEINEYLNEFEVTEDNAECAIWYFLSGLEAAGIFDNDRKHQIYDYRVRKNGWKSRF